MTQRAFPLVFLGLSLLVAATSLPGCSDSGDPTTPAPKEPNANTIQIAMVVSLSGPAKAIGDESKRGAEVAVAQINALGGVLGKKLDLVVENDSSDPVQTKQKVLAFAERGVKLGIGPSTSTAAEAMKDLVAADQVLYVSPSATSEILDQVGAEKLKDPEPGQPPLGPVFFRTAATDVFLSAAMAQYAANVGENSARRCPNMVILAQNDEYGKPIAEAVNELITRRFSLGVKRTIQLDPTVDNQAKLNDAAALAGGQLDAECQLVVAQPEVAAAYMRAFRSYVELNPNKRPAATGGWGGFLTIGSDGFRQEEFIIAGRNNAAEVTAATAGEGSIAIAADTTPNTPEYNSFANLFAARFPSKVPGRYGSTAYDAVVLLAAAIERAATTTELKPIRDALYTISQGRLRVGPNKMTDMFDYIRRGEDVNYEGASGTLDFTTTGHVRSAFGVWKIINATFVKQSQFDVSELGSISGQ